jgi:drug/metabolite transporter (DMT)-like permease
MTHRQAVLTLLVATFLWSIAGVVTRQLDTARSFEVTFWRSAANAVALTLILGWQRTPAGLLRALRDGGGILWVSGLCWTVMFTAFMVALTLTTVANVLVTMALGPLFTALLARLTLGQRLPARTWAAIVTAGIGIAWMYGSEVSGAEPRHLTGILVALSVPMAAAVMWTLLQRNARAHPDDRSDMTPAVLIGAVLSSLVTLPLSWPFQASLHDIGWLSMLGVVQLAIPCAMAVAAGKVLQAPEAALLGLLEIIFGVALTWLGTPESPSIAVVGGGLLVIAALAGNEAIALKARRTDASSA